VGARNEQQLEENLGAPGWSPMREQVLSLDAASQVTPPYPNYAYWNGQFAERKPPPV
jgi:aryl-alcohol dehydrogenase-like predicted oxidoreductase